MTGVQTCALPIYVVEGYVSSERAASDYGVALVRKGHEWSIDEAATKKLRGKESV